MMDMGGMGKILDLLKNAGQMRDKAQTALAELRKRTVEGAAGAGMVVAVMNGAGELVGLRFDRASVNPDDLEMLGDLVVSAVADARKKADEVRTGILRDVAGGMDLSALGIDLGKLM